MRFWSFSAICTFRIDCEISRNAISAISLVATPMAFIVAGVLKFKIYLCMLQFLFVFCEYARQQHYYLPHCHIPKLFHKFSLYQKLVLRFEIITQALVTAWIPEVLTFPDFPESMRKWIRRRSKESLARCVMFWAKSRAICIRVWRRTSLQRTKSRNANRRCRL